MNDITPETLPEAGGEAAVVDSSNLKDFMKEVTGKDFPTDEAARKSLKDTYSSVSESARFKNAVEKAAEQKGVDASELLASLSSDPGTSTNPDMKDFVSRSQYEEDTFFSANKELLPYKDILMTLREKAGSFEKAVEIESFKDLYSKAMAHDEQEGAKSVLHSNPRLSKVSDKMTSAHEMLLESNKALQSGNPAAAFKATQAAGSIAVEAVLEAFPGK